MGFLDKLLKTVETWLPDEEQENIDKCREFERYVAEIFAKQEKYSQLKIGQKITTIKEMA
ncbi:MAG: hypothetical protein QMD80_03565 [archaeon]|nr:hypothetical protein [archaeon]